MADVPSLSDPWGWFAGLGFLGPGVGVGQGEGGTSWFREQLIAHRHNKLIGSVSAGLMKELSLAIDRRSWQHQARQHNLLACGPFQWPFRDPWHDDTTRATHNKQMIIERASRAP